MSYPGIFSFTKPCREIIMKRNTHSWLSCYLYYAEPWEKFLVNQVKPFVESVIEKGLAEQFFFIRYWERGPHIRLRFKGSKNLINKTLKKKLKDEFLSFFHQHPSVQREPGWAKELPPQDQWCPNNSLKFIEYEPEIDRYGGPAGIGIAEEQFQHSSESVLAILGRNPEWSYDIALGAAIQAHLAFAFALGMNIKETQKFFSRIFKSWFLQSCGMGTTGTVSKEEFKKKKNETDNAFKTQFEKQKSELIPFHESMWRALEDGAEFEEDWLNLWKKNMKKIGHPLKECQNNNRLIFPKTYLKETIRDIPQAHQKRWLILESYVHMTNNRFGILNRDEAFLGYLIKSSLEEISG
jgi:hypothetical protein